MNLKDVFEGSILRAIRKPLGTKTFSLETRTPSDVHSINAGIEKIYARARAAATPPEGSPMAGPLSADESSLLSGMQAALPHIIVSDEVARELMVEAVKRLIAKHPVELAAFKDNESALVKEMIADNTKAAELATKILVADSFGEDTHDVIALGHEPIKALDVRDADDKPMAAEATVTPYAAPQGS